MPLNLEDVKAFADQTLILRMHERMKNLIEEKIEVTRSETEASDRLTEIDNELDGIEARLRGIAAALRAVLNRIDPPGPPGP